MTDKRKAKRRIVTSGAAIFCGGGTALIPCLMEDVSDAGARLKLDPAAEVPADFILVLSRNKKLNRRCQIVWREKGEIGVRFLAPHSISPEQTQPRCLDGEPLSDQRNKDKPESANGTPNKATAFPREFDADPFVSLQNTAYFGFVLPKWLHS